MKTKGYIRFFKRKLKVNKVADRSLRLLLFISMTVVSLLYYAPNVRAVSKNYHTDSGNTWICGSAYPGMTGILTDSSIYSCTNDTLTFNDENDLIGTWIMTEPYLQDTSVTGQDLYYFIETMPEYGDLYFYIGYSTGDSFTPFGYQSQYFDELAGEKIMDLSSISGVVPTGSQLTLRLEADSIYYDYVSLTLGNTVDTAGYIRFTIDEKVPCSDAVSGLSADQVTYSSIGLTWDPLFAADDYRIYRDDILAGTVTDAMFTDNALDANVTNNYKVRGYNAAEDCESPVASIDVTTLPVSAEPSSYYFGEISSGEVNLTIANESFTDSVVLESIAFSGPDAAEFGIGAVDTCTSAILDPGGTCMLEIAFTPTTDVYKTANVEISTSPGTQPLLILLEGGMRPFLVKDIKPGPNGSVPTYLAKINDILFFVADDGDNGSELWKSDGTKLGTVLVKDINPGPNGSAPDNLTNINGTLFFRADDGVSGSELWKSNGTEEGTVLVKDINLDADSSTPSSLTEVNGTLFFSANDGTHGYEFWKSDGTEMGTVRVKDINPGPGNSSLNYLTNGNGTLFFRANDGIHGNELWKSDGTEEGTVLVKDINPDASSSTPSYMTEINGTIFFSANDGTHGYELWKSDGTESGTVLVKDIYLYGGYSSPSILTNINGTLFFRADDRVSGSELWKSDGTEGGTVRVRDILPGSAGSSPLFLVDVGGMLFFRAKDSTNGYELWMSDGTELGTVLVKDILPGTGSSAPSYLTNVNGTLFFLANDGTNGSELWKSDGTEAGTVLVRDINPGPGSSTPSFLIDVGGMLFFRANDNVAGEELWALTKTKTPPTVSPIADQDTYDKNPIEVAFTVSDLDTDSNALVITATSENSSILPDGNIVLGGEGDNRTILMTPLPGEGTTNVTIEVSDGELSTIVTFKVEWWLALVVGTSEKGPAVEYFTIQAALNDASNNDIIVVTDGVYTGIGNKNITLNGTKNITLRSDNGPENTIIDMQGNGRAFNFLGGSTSVLDGFSIINGGGPVQLGGAIYIINGSAANSPVITNCIFRNNNATDQGGAIWVAIDPAISDMPVITNCSFIENAVTSSLSSGGAIFINILATSGDSFIEIANCRFLGNYGFTGGAIGIDTASGASPSQNSIIKDSKFFENNAFIGGAISDLSYAFEVINCAFSYNSAFAGGVFGPSFFQNRGTGGLVRNSIFWKNSARFAGGVVYQANGSNEMTFSHCTFTDNESQSSGGAFFFAGTAAIKLSNSILWGNSATEQGNQIYIYDSQVNLSVQNSIIEGGLTEIHDPDISPTINSQDIIDLDPKFALPEDFHLMPDSPGIDTGTDSPYGGLLATGMDGNIRPLDGDEDGSYEADMGAYEFDRNEFPVAAVSPPRLVFTARKNEALPEVQTLSIRSRGGSTLNWAIIEDIPWLRIDNDQIQGSSTDNETNTVNLYVDHSGMSHGIYTGNLKIVDPAGSPVYRTVEITLYVTAILNVKQDICPDSDEEAGVYCTIQEAIDAAIHGDDVALAEDTYTGAGNKDISFLGKRITVRSAGDPQATIIDCENSGRGFDFSRGETNASVVQGLTIKRGNVGQGEGGGGILIRQTSSPTILGCFFVDNDTPSSDGGGISIWGSGVRIINSTFSGNTAYRGGAISNSGGAERNIIDGCVFLGNHGSTHGGAIYSNGQFLVVNNCKFEDNYADNGSGGGIYAKASSLETFSSGDIFLTVSGCSFIHNLANGSNTKGGGLYIENQSARDANVYNCVFGKRNGADFGAGIATNATGNGSTNIINCTLYDNVAHQDTGGGGLNVISGTANITNTLFHKNLWSFSGQFYYENNLSISGNATFSYCTISDLSSYTLNGTNNNNYDPKFIDTANNDFRLDPSSYCIDRGLTIPWLFSDIRGSIRPVDGNQNGVAKFDIGAYEYSEYYGGLPGDLTAKAFKDLAIDTSVAVTGFDYEISWRDKDPFPFDPRIKQAEDYDVNLALVSEYGRRIELGTYTVPVIQHGYTVPYVFGPRHVGNWQLRLELVTDPNQFLLSDKIYIYYKDAVRYALSDWIIPPEGAYPDQKPDVEDEGVCYWSVQSNRLYAIAPTTTVVTWYGDEKKEFSIPVVTFIDYPDRVVYEHDPDTMIHVADSMPVNLLPEGTRFNLAQRMYADNDATISTSKFTASVEGWCVIKYFDHEAIDVNDKERFDVVRTYAWYHQMNDSKPLHPTLNPDFPFEKEWDIGDEITDEDHNAICNNGYIFFEEAYYDGAGENKAYDRLTRNGQIFAVNENNPDIIEDDMLVVWYRTSSVSDVCWPSKPVHYDTVWPEDAKKIVIASRLGSGPLPPGLYGQMANMLVYNQPEPDLPGTNPNEEHAAFFAAQGSSDPGVFSLRTDLNRTNWKDTRKPYTSEPYTLLKYRNPLNGAWDFEVYKVVAQSENYIRKSSGQVIADYGKNTRYYIDENGELQIWTGYLPAISASYYIDADGYLVNPADEVNTCYNFMSSIEIVDCLPASNVKVHYIDPGGQLHVTEDPPPSPSYSLDVHGVIVESDVYYRFHYSGFAGMEINPPYPLNQLTFGPCGESYIEPGYAPSILKDKDNKFFAKHAGINGNPTVDIVLRYFYRLQSGFTYDLNADGFQDETIGTPIPWLEGLDGTFDGQTPVKTTFAISWPDPVPTLFVGETLTDAKTQEGETVGLPNIKDQCIVNVLFDQALRERGGTFDSGSTASPSVKLVDPIKEYSVGWPLADPQGDLPQELKPKYNFDTNRWVFSELPYHIQSRLTYDAVDETLNLKGIFKTGTGESLLLMNTINSRDIMEIARPFAEVPNDLDPATVDIHDLLPDPLETRLNNLRTKGDNGLVGSSSLKFVEMKALTAGVAEGPRLATTFRNNHTDERDHTGYYVTLAFNNDTDDCPGPVSLSVIKVDVPLYRGQIKVIESDDVFEEKVTLRHNGDFGGNSKDRWFQWRYLTADFQGIPYGPDNPAEKNLWKDYFAVLQVPGENDPIPNNTTGLLQLIDNTINTTRTGFRYDEEDMVYKGAVDVIVQGTGQQLLPDKWFSVRYYYNDIGNELSRWTKPQLYEGWIKRVMKKINLFDQKVKDFHTSEVNTLASMISLAGRRHEGSIALSGDPDNLNNLGIIEIYGTLLTRGRELTIEQEYNAQDTNMAILFAANRLAGLYMMLGNEAYADAIDPTIGFSTEDGQYGTMAPSIFCFKNQVENLLEEELVLLRGRDDSGEQPFYNRFIWNFTLGEGEVAYKESYNITDQNEDGQVNELDAMIQFPQGHGDAWGHYLTASKYYYDLLTHQYFTWVPQTEAILVEQTPVEVDYRDERRFASVAAAKARTGAEIVNLTYRQQYVEDPEGQWQGYKDLDPVRAWGVDGWSRRAGQGAYFDWVVGNAILPPDLHRRPPTWEYPTVESEGQTEFILTDILYIEGINYLEIFVNGISQKIDATSNTDVVTSSNAENKTVITFSQGLSSGDELLVKLYKGEPPAFEFHTAGTGNNNKDFILLDVLYIPGTNYLEVFVDNTPQVFFADYSLSSQDDTYETVVTFNEPLSSGQEVTFKLYDLVEGIQKVDRKTVLELAEIADSYSAVQAEVDKANVGLNPLGLAKNVVPFDIDPAAVANGQTHFEQIYNRSVQAMNNAIAVFNHANKSTQLLRHQQDSLADFKRNVDNSEADNNNRLIEVFGYPYPDDCGPGRTYPTEYCESGPDLYHFMYVEPSELMGVRKPKVHEFEMIFKDIKVDAKGALQESEKTVTFHIDTDSRFGLIKPRAWQGRRKSPGEIQMARSDLLQIRGQFEKAVLDYENQIVQIERQAEIIALQHGLNTDEISVLNAQLNENKTLNISIKESRAFYEEAIFDAGLAKRVANAISEGIPKVIGIVAGVASGTITDILSALRQGAKELGIAAAKPHERRAGNEQVVQQDISTSKEILSAETNITLTTLRGEFAVKQQVMQLENLVRSEMGMRYEIYNLVESMQQSAGRYLAALAKGSRLLQDRLRFRKQTAAQIANYRYKDMTFRIFRNDALQKYRAQFDMAARYVYLAAKAYDYETTLLDHSTMAGQKFLTDIVRQRTIGMIENGQPLTGSGLADPMKRMWQNFQVLKPQLGFNNPQRETNRFSLRQELFRIKMDESSNDTWRQILTANRVPDLWDIPEFRRYCRPFAAEGIPEPGIVISFTTAVTSRLNFFRWPLGGGDSSYSSSNFATKIRSVGTWFSNYNSVGLSQTPRIYLIPVGEDVLRTPSYYTDNIRTWQVIDQKLPIPFPINTTEMANDMNWIPTVNTIFDEMFQIRRHSDFRAYHDSGYLDQSEMQYDSRLIGRSVWNTKWVLIIPGSTLLYDPDEGLDTFINGPLKFGGLPNERTGNGILDIKLFFETYSYSGN